MLRISARYAKPGMVLRRPVYDNAGILLFDPLTTLDEGRIEKLVVYGVSELIVDDPRVEDVPVQPLVAPEIEAEAVRALRDLLSESRGERSLHDLLVKALSKPLVSMAREFFPDCVGEPNVAGTTRQEDYATVRPVKVASMALLLARKTGSTMLQLADLGMAAALMDVGVVLLSEANLARFDPIQGPMNGRLDPSTSLHPAAGAALAQSSSLVTAEAATAIAQHHERWDGSGYPNGLKGEEISRYARILAITDAYFDLVSSHGGHKALAPNQAAEYIMAYSGELFDPALVQVFMTEVPLYPNGVTVRLSTGEIGIVADVNIGYVGRPIVRVVSDERGRNIRTPYDMNLADQENQGRLIVQVMDY
jgi:HD-GYP domain-containing protein (c-di-GMP phosphodiesterase class II)